MGTTLPPLLPTVFTVSVFVSDERLALKRVTTVNPESILIAGKVTRAFFDKTGTLTKQGLDFISADNFGGEVDKLKNHLSLAMATCHSLTRSRNGDLLGNPVDRTMFLATGATLHESNGNSTVISLSDTDSNKQVEIVRLFDFDHHRMTQSVVVRLQNGRLVAFVKGSGESIQRLCNQSSIPENFEATMRESARSGIYQISVAMKAIETDSVGSLARDQIEHDLEFVGVVNFQNTVRAETRDVIRQLEEGEVQSIMVTGDSVMTGVRVAVETGIIKPGRQIIIGTLNNSSELVWTLESGETIELPTFEKLELGLYEIAVSGKAWSVLRTTSPKLAAQLTNWVRVFGRCTPYDKVSVVKSFVELGFITLMCGDGGNDAGALKVAHVGVALSDAEASIVAPFTSLDKDIRSVLDVLKEGRCALASALSAYKYMIMYGQIETLNQIINAYFQITFADWCWVFMDGFWTITLAFSLPLSRPSKTLPPTRPTASILGPQTLASTLGVLALNFIFTVIALATLWHQPFFQCRKWDSTDVSNVLVIGDNYESEVLFLVTGYQYISSAMTYNFGYEFRQAWIFNYLFVFFVAVYTFIQFYITMVPSKLSCFFRVNCENKDVVHGIGDLLPIQNAFNTTVMPYDFRVKILVIMITNTIAIMAFEYFVVNGVRQYWAAKKRSQQLAGTPKESDSDTEAEAYQTCPP